MAKRKQTWLRASTYRRQRLAGWQRPALSRQTWSPREEARRMKNRRSPRYPHCSQASAKLRSPGSAFFRKIAEGHAAGSATGILLRKSVPSSFGPTIMTRLAGPRCLKTSPDYVGVLARFLPHAPQACRWLAAARIDPLRQRYSRQLRGHNERPPNLPLNSPAKPSHRHEIPIWPDIRARPVASGRLCGSGAPVCSPSNDKRWQDMNPDEQAVLIRQISGAVNGLQFRVQDLEEAVKVLQERLKKP